MLFIIIGFILLVIWLIGVILPLLPGTILSYIGLLFILYAQYTSTWMIDRWSLIVWWIVAILLQLSDYIIPSITTKKYGGSAWWTRWSVIGMIAWLFVIPPRGLIIMPIIGAYIGEYLHTSDHATARRSAWGSFIGFLTGTWLKIIIAIAMIIHGIILVV